MFVDNDFSHLIAIIKETEPTHENMRLAVRLLDLTSLNDEDTTEDIEHLCRSALTPAGPVSAVCVYPRFVETAARSLQSSAVGIATVISFPYGKDSPHTIESMTSDAVNAGAGEIDIVMNYEAFINGNEETVRTALRACRNACTGHVKMKVILESGAFVSDEDLVGACRLALDEGADFLKTSTGKTGTGATLEAAAIMLSVIHEYSEASGFERKIGFKASGGIRTPKQAVEYLALASAIMGEVHINPETFRIGASSLKDALLDELGLLHPKKDGEEDEPDEGY